MRREKIINALSIAGVDPSAGAGVFADIKVMSALGVYGCGVVTALTAQNTRTVQDILITPPDFIAKQLETLFSDILFDSVKIGMIAQSDAIIAVKEKLVERNLKKIILDPVMFATSGDQLIESSAIACIRELLLPFVTLITPNLPEVGALLNKRPPENIREMRSAAEEMRNKMSNSIDQWILIKGGHLSSANSIDILYDGNKMIEIAGKRLRNSKFHGTGCSLSAAITALLPEQTVPNAINIAKSYLLDSIRSADILKNVGSGNCLHHFHNLW